MKKYTLEKGKDIIGYFLNTGYINLITRNELLTVLDYLSNREKDKLKSYFLVNDSYEAIAIIDSLRETCYIYSNCGINFDISVFMNGLNKCQKDFSAFVCDEVIFKRLEDYFEPNHILIKKEMSIYSQGISEILSSTTPYEEKSEILLNGDAFDILYKTFVKIITENKILFINQAYAGIIKVDNSENFIQSFYEVVEKEYYVQISEQETLTGQLIQLKSTTTIYDLDLGIESLIIIKNQFINFEVIYFDSLKESFQELANELVSHLTIDQTNSFYFIDNKVLDLAYFIELGFKLENKKTYLYYLHNKSKINNTIPELRNDLKITENHHLVKVFIINLLIALSCIVMHFLKIPDHLYIAIVSFLFLAISLPLALIKTYVVTVKERQLKIHKMKVDPNDVFIIFVFVSICFMYRFTTGPQNNIQNLLYNVLFLYRF